ncbi:GNAT family N-acetyltransferase [Nocardia stercoris]|uniref:GNAT family N-acetyltransferase n=1 Tax=Nocardia stercoris TaxID=2483361 RepID=A0A3M2KZK8_9NOCA|nr:GNAT family N-acetyltransferase [Nocardia stercoris]RMI30096.1 GNAT family N-acetyltransferase [Nocardia stercoris]
MPEGSLSAAFARLAGRLQERFAGVSEWLARDHYTPAAEVLEREVVGGGQDAEAGGAASLARKTDTVAGQDSVAAAPEPTSEPRLSTAYFDDLGPAHPVTAIGRASASDGPGITRSHVLGSRDALRNSGTPEQVRNFLGARYPDWTRAWAERARTEPGLFTARTADGEVAGFVWATVESEGVGKIQGLYVRPRWHGHGTGVDLLNHAKAHLAQQGVTRIELETTASSDALGWYRRRGFRLDGPLTDTPPPMRAHGLVAPQQPLVWTSE